MNAEVLLDREGCLPVPPDYQVVESEVDFLRYATEDLPLLIRGERLCAWAEAFYTLRRRPYRYRESLSAALRRAFPNLSQDQASTLARKIGIDAASLDQISSRWVLEHCYPDDLVVWKGAPSQEHAAKWLLWLCTHQPDDTESIILHQLAALLRNEAGSLPEAQVYQAVNFTQARAFLDTWLGLDGKELIGLGEFPVEVPTGLLKEIKSEWMKRLIESNGTYFEKMLAFPLPVALRQELAQLAFEFFRQNPKYLTQEIIRQLQPYLATPRLIVLEECLPPSEPASMPVEELAVLDWFQDQYLPYRRWLAHYGDERAREKAQLHAQDFAHWYLTRYPQWLLKSDWLSFQRTAHLRETTQDKLTLCVILDGLPAWDAEDFAHTVSARIERLQLQQKAYCFAPLPTVTEFAKDALLKGVPPHLAPEYLPLGHILPDNASPMRELENSRPGDLFLWCIGQPDTAYHFEADSKRKKRIHAELDAILQMVQEVVEVLPSGLPLQVIVTTDHGRLLNPKSPRRLPVPNGMQAHGRIAWGKMNRQFDESGFSVEEDAGWVAVHGERFGMSHDMLIAWGENSFQNANTAYEPYPHGGLFPEEAIVPWFVFERDAQVPDLSVAISGEGEAESVGTINIRITNPGRIVLKCLGIVLSHGAQVAGNWNVPPLQETRFAIPLAPWPVKADLATLRATLLFQQPSGRTFTLEITPSLEVVTLYERDDSLLKDLDL
jgi:hypothetical protein